nr:probable U3 small nucleolar RNA-associated protein 7 [Tanacetum cinerariifolium]
MVNAEGILDVLMDKLNALDPNNREFTVSLFKVCRNLLMIFEDQAERLDFEHQYGDATANVHSVAMSSRLDALRVMLFTKPTADAVPKRVNDEIDKYVDAVRETVRDVLFLHNELFFDDAQKKYMYIYNQSHAELHCLKVGRMAL